MGRPNFTDKFILDLEYVERTLDLNNKDKMLAINDVKTHIDWLESVLSKLDNFDEHVDYYEYFLGRLKITNMIIADSKSLFKKIDDGVTHLLGVEYSSWLCNL